MIIIWPLHYCSKTSE